MIFVKNTFKNKARFKNINFQVYQTARRTILFRRMNAQDMIMDKYLKDNLNISLKSACLALIRKAKYLNNEDGDIFMTFEEKKYEDLARLITFGNGKILGSTLLKDATKIRKKGDN